jgi:hypothetical protein
VVAKEVLGVVQTLFQTNPPDEFKLIEVKVGESPFSQLLQDSCAITLYEQERYYARFTYQLAHELGHMMLGLRRTNMLIETLATVVMLKSLEKMKERWAKSPSSPDWAEYAPQFTLYRERNEAWHLARFPLQVRMAVMEGKWHEISLYLRYRRDEADNLDLTDDLSRDLQMLAAIRLLAEEIPWSDLTGLANLTSPTPLEDPDHRKDLLIEYNLAPPQVLPLFRVLGRNCPTSFFAAKFQTPPSVLEDSGFLFQEDDQWVWLEEFDQADDAYWKKQITEIYRPTSWEWDNGV